MPSQAFRTVVIPIVIGTWTNAALWGLEVCMVYLYYSRACSRDGPLMRTAVAICTIVDTACTAVTMSCVYGYTVTNWGNEAYLLRQGWHFPAYVLLTATTAIVVQSYFIQRYLRLSRNFIVTGLLAILSLLAFAGSIALSSIVARYPDYSERSKIKIPAILWAGSKAVCDTAIACTLIFHLLRYRANRQPLQHTRKLISTLCVLAIETSTPTAVIASAGLITYLENNSSNAPTGILFNLGRAYSITLLMNLLMRETLSTPGHTNADPEFGLPKSILTTPSVLMNAIAVQHETIVEVDRERPKGEQSGEEQKPVPLKCSPTSSDFAVGKDIASDPNAFQVSYPKGSRTSSQASFTS
ncbi:hypothetical protein BT69DRAFT_1284404 [Atractiella rhizophila]|nr:hypothetical protein BT69DRAFT_1284404 [Atractiella rhizophila]